MGTLSPRQRSNISAHGVLDPAIKFAGKMHVTFTTSTFHVKIMNCKWNIIFIEMNYNFKHFLMCKICNDKISFYISINFMFLTMKLKPAGRAQRYVLFWSVQSRIEQRPFLSFAFNLELRNHALRDFKRKCKNSLWWLTRSKAPYLTQLRKSRQIKVLHIKLLFSENRNECTIPNSLVGKDQL